MKHWYRGFTLFEVLLATVLLGILLTVASYILIQGLHAWSTAMSRTDEEDTVLVASSKLVDRLTKTDPRSLTLYDEPASNGPFVPVVTGSPAVALSFLAGEDYLPLTCGACGCKKAVPGSMQWTRFLVWYAGADTAGSTLTGQALYLKTVWLLPSHQPTANPNPYSLAGFSPDPGDQIMVRNVELNPGFEVSSPLEIPCLVACCAPTYHINPVTFSIHLKWQGGRIIYHKNYTSSASMLENTCQDPGLAPMGPSPSPPPCSMYCPNCCDCCAPVCPSAISTGCDSPACCCTGSP